MRAQINVNDAILISAYLDDQLSPDEKQRTETRLASDPAFKQALTELAYTRRLMWSLPKKHAPRNFTISPQTVKRPVYQPWLRPALSFVSVAAAVMFVVVFGSGLLLNRQARQMAPEAAMLSGAEVAVSEATPYIINWDPIQSGGGGGGGADPLTEGYYGPQDNLGGAGGPGFGLGGGPAATEVPIEPTEPPLTSGEPTLKSTEPPLTADSPAAGGESTSNLILGLPEEEAQGKVLSTEPAAALPSANPLSSRLVLLIVAGGTALVAGLAALFLRRR
ncbi:MAG TPA: hypothetical protein PK040_06820 [Anaerolineaceae bacterium]|nr:hypothetical protein [Anaerolineaceae bacterium]